MLLTYTTETVDLSLCSWKSQKNSSKSSVSGLSYTALASICFLLWTCRNIRSSPILPNVTMSMATRVSLWISPEYLDGVEHALNNSIVRGSHFSLCFVLSPLFILKCDSLLIIYVLHICVNFTYKIIFTMNDATN